MKCPICPKQIEKGAVITCKTCWWLIPGGERVALSRLYRKNPAAIGPKLLRCVRLVHEKHPELAPT